MDGVRPESKSEREDGSLLLLLLLLIFERGVGRIKHRALHHFLADAIEGFLGFDQEFVQSLVEHVLDRERLQIGEQALRGARRLRARARAGFPRMRRRKSSTCETQKWSERGNSRRR